jgi:hypothetical protein
MPTQNERPERSERDLYPLQEARERLGGISRALLYSLVRDGEVKLTKLGRRSFISGDELRRVAKRGDCR